MKLERIGQEVRVLPPCDVALAPLHSLRHALVKDDRGACRVDAVPQPLGVVYPRYVGPGTYYPAGLTPVILELLRRAGYRVFEDGDRAVPLPEPAGPDGRGLEPEDATLLRFAHLHERGLIRYGSGVNPAWLIAQLRLGFPDATIAVATGAREDAWRLGRCLKSILPGAMVVDDRHRAPAGPLVVTTFMGLGGDSVDLHKRHILVVLDAAEALTRYATMALDGAPQARLYGLLARSRQLAPFDADRVQALFGLDEVAIPRHGHVPRPVEVVGFPITGGPAVAPGCDLVGLKRRACWLNPIRNRRIARLAIALASGDRSRILAESKMIALHIRKPGVLRVVIVVENVEQALAIGQSIPGWPLIVAESVATAGLSARRAAALDARRWAGGGFPDHAIATLAGLDASDPGDVDVAVRADCGASIPAALGRLTITRNQNAYPLVLVDVEDRHQPVLRRRGERRRSAYRAESWMVDGQWGMTFPLNRILASGSWGGR